MWSTRFLLYFKSTLSTMGSCLLQKVLQHSNCFFAVQQLRSLSKPGFFQKPSFWISMLVFGGISEVCTKKCSPTWSSMYETTVIPNRTSDFPHILPQNTPPKAPAPLNWWDTKKPFHQVPCIRMKWLPPVESSIPGVPRNFPGFQRGIIFEGLEMGNDGKTRWEMAGLV